MDKSLSVILLWHMHQPFYKDPLKDEYILPWTYLHAVKDYYDMAAIVDEVPGARAVFNFVPSLLEQLEDYASGTAVDPFLLHGRMNPAEMGDEQRFFVINNFFAANRQRLIEPNRRYCELFRLAGEEAGNAGALQLRQFKDQDILDLQVCFFLAWTGEAARRRYPELQQLVAKGRGYTLEDKDLLFDCHTRILRSIIPLYRKLHGEGKVELSVTPYFHPILPLLCDIRSAAVAMPKVHLPVANFRHPEDARSQIRAGITCFTRVFGFPPAGIWPSEGSVSDQALTAIADAGLQWAASDEGVLSASLGGLGIGREAIYHPYLFAGGEKELALFFRDHTLSDLIGFTYTQWEEQRAITDFIGRIAAIAANVHDARVVPVILDGENAWEYYPDNGYHFLKGLYEALAASEGITLSTCSEVLSAGVTRKLSRIHPGSWINANYAIWIGHPEENQAWDLLARTRDAAIRGNSRVAALLAGGVSDLAAEEDQVAARICRALFAAEGSDWFWWYGDDHFSPHSDQFDLLFRRHLLCVHRLLGGEIPPELYEPIKKKSPAGFVREPAGFITPAISGLVGDYFEWLAAGLYDLSRQSSTMHSAESGLKSFYYGYDRNAFYFRIDAMQPLESYLRMEDSLTLVLTHKKDYRLVMRPPAGFCKLQVREGRSWQDLEHFCTWAVGRICEVQIPLAALGLDAGEYIYVSLVHGRGDDELGRWPADSPMKLMYAGVELELDTWLI
jgi:alpha-amylase/alpha-mannosidase (GH57 family)